MKRKLCALAALLMAAVMLFTGCSSSGNGGGDGEVLRYCITSDLTALDPAFAYDGPTMAVMLQVSEGVMALNTEGHVVPCLAKESKRVDETTYVYTMRDDVTFSDGSPMTMEDVIYSLERHRNPQVGSYLAWMYDNVDEIKQSGDWELTITLHEPDACWPYVLATAAGHVIKKDYCEEKGEDFGSPAGSVIATGPYVVDNWAVGSGVTLKYNEKYWDKSLGEPDFKTVEYSIISEDTTRAAAIKSGQVDFDIMIPGGLYGEVSASENAYTKIKPSNNTLFLSFNCAREPFTDVNVRRAIACAIDKQALQDNVVKEAATMANMLPNGPSLFTFEKESWEAYAAGAESYSYDMERAKEYLAQSEYPDGFEVTLLVDEQNMYNAIALTIQQSLAELGITVNIQRITQDELIAIEFGGQMDGDDRNYDMALFEWEADWPDPSGNLMGIFNSAFLGEGGTNFPSYQNAKVDELLNAQAVIEDEAQRTQYLQQALDIIIDEAPVVPILYSNYISAYHNRIADSFDFITWCCFVKDMKLK